MAEGLRVLFRDNEWDVQNFTRCTLPRVENINDVFVQLLFLMPGYFIEGSPMSLGNHQTRTHTILEAVSMTLGI